MNLYLANGRYYGTQADARRADRGYGPVEVPTDKAGLIAYLNGLAPAPAPSPAAASPQAAGRPSCETPAGLILSRMDGGAQTDSITEAILKSDGYALERYAGAVAVAFRNLAKGS